MSTPKTAFRMRQLEKRFGRLEQQLVEAHQRIARTFMPGKVSSVRKAGQDWQVRLELGRDAETDVPVLSPWVPVQPVSAGGLAIKAKPTVGERFGLLSPSGVVGSGSWSVRGPFDDDHPAPEGDEDVVLKVGASLITVADGKIKMTVGSTLLELAGSGATLNGTSIDLSGGSLTHNDLNIGSTHVHGGVMIGPADTSTPH